MTNARLKNAFHYVISVTNAAHMEFGATQLIKTILFADVISLMRRKKAISGATFVKDKYGPVPDGYIRAIKELKAEKRIRRIPPAQKGDSTRFISLTGPDLSLFTQEETDILAGVAKEIAQNYTAAMISDLTHNDIWQMSDKGEKIPLAAYFPSRVIPSTPAQIQATRKELEAKGYEFVA